MQRETRPQDAYSTTVDPTKEVVCPSQPATIGLLTTVGLITFFDWLWISGGLL